MSEILKCDQCEKQDESVERLNCGYHEEVHGETFEEVICKDCEYKHLLEI